MKKILMAAFALLMLPVLLISSSGTAIAAKAVDEGYKQLQILSLPSTYSNGTYMWHINYCRDNFNQNTEDMTHLNALSLSGAENTYYDDVTAIINWRTGIATFANNELNLTVTFDTNYISKNGSGKNTNYQYGGGGTVIGYILYDSVQYDVNTTLESNIDITEYHYISEPEPEVSIDNIVYDYSTSPATYYFDVQNICWQNTAPYRIQIALTGQGPSAGKTYSAVDIPPKGPDSKYPQNLDIYLDVDSTTFSYLEPVMLQVMLLDRNLNVITSSYPRWYTWGGEGEDD